ncbi:MAG: ATP synthase F0 subunit A [Planctomycetales bacterium 4572_13]|nr:MAG: ATP synthase F0 subunit A [Planctomycetales bacterium 4572_13]
MGMFGILLANIDPLSEVVSKPLLEFRVGSWTLVFTNHMFMIALASIVLMVGLPLAIRQKSLVPHGFRNVVETICVYLREDMARPMLKEHTDRYIGVLWTMFFFILTMNLLGLAPLDKIVWLFTKKEHWGGAATANIFVTGALATFAFLLFHAAGIREKGIVKYLATLSPEVPWPIMPFMFVMELLSSFVRLFSLAIRLFANILAGHILIGVLLGFIMMFKNYMVATASITITTLMSLLEIFVAFLQAYIFVFLTVVFIMFAVSEEH